MTGFTKAAQIFQVQPQRIVLAVESLNVVNVLGGYQPVVIVETFLAQILITPESTLAQLSPCVVIASAVASAACFVVFLPLVNVVVSLVFGAMRWALRHAAF